MKQPKIKRVKLKVDPYRGAAALATSIVPPEGYAFRAMVRKGTHVTITYVLVDETEASS